jgi:hypothetical protein
MRGGQFPFKPYFLSIGVSPQLLKHMQGKSCFYFQAIDEGLISELSALAQDGIEQFRKDGLH